MFKCLASAALCISVECKLQKSVPSEICQKPLWWLDLLPSPEWSSKLRYDQIKDDLNWLDDHLGARRRGCRGWVPRAACLEGSTFFFCSSSEDKAEEVTHDVRLVVLPELSFLELQGVGAAFLGEMFSNTEDRRYLFYLYPCNIRVAA